MKRILFLGILCGLVVTPSSAAALSCLSPDMMIDDFVNEPRYTIFVAVAGETKEYVRQAASTDGDPNRQFPSGYSAQLVAVSEAYKGYTSDSQWVYHQRDSTWNYLCAGGPVEAGSEMLYIVSQTNGTFDVISVVNSFPADSELATQIITALGDSTGTVQAVTPETWRERLEYQIQDMIFLLRVKLGEWRSWSV